MAMHRSGELETVLENAGVLVPLEGEEAASTEGGETVVGKDAADNVGVAHAKDGKTHDVKKVI
jgi:hypothetical protein